MEPELVKKFIETDQSAIEGWFSQLDQVAFLEVFLAQNQLQIGGDVAEVGVFQGKSLVMLSILKNPNERLIGFDIFAADQKQQTQSNIDKYGIATGLSLIQGDTSAIERKDMDAQLQSPLRFLHIDAGHEYHEVLEQLHLFSPYLADGGIISMDDYQDREFPGIEAAVLDFSEIDRPRRFVPFLSSGNKLFLCCVPMATTFQKLLVNRQNFSDSCRLTRVRDFNILIMRSKLPVSKQTIINQLDQLGFPKRPDNESTLNERARQFSQLTFGSGKT
jgi:cephalosporin hydroxylase